MAKFLSKDGKFYMRDGKLLRPTNILEVPIVATKLTYNGKAQSPAIYGYDENTMTMGGVTSGTNVGTYQITFTPKSGYEWSDGTSETKHISWSITKAAGSLSLSTSSLTIDANSTTGSFTVTRAGDGAISAISSNTGVATVSVSGNTITVTKVGQGSATITVSVAEGTNHTAPASKTCSVTCRIGPPISSLAVGSSVYMNVNGTAREFIVVNQGKPSSIYDDSCDGTWLLMKDPYWRSQWHRFSDNDYANSVMHSSLNSTYLALFDSNIQNAIKQVKIPYRAGSGYDKTVTSGASGLSAKIFLLSCTEVNIVDGYEPTNEGACLSYFSGTVQNGPDTKRVAYMDGSAADWWLRSPFCTSLLETQYATCVRSNGRSRYQHCSSSEGIRPTLVLPFNTLVDANMNVIANST